VRQKTPERDGPRHAQLLEETLAAGHRVVTAEGPHSANDPTPRRRFWFGRRLGVDDFEREQDYLRRSPRPSRLHWDRRIPLPLLIVALVGIRRCMRRRQSRVGEQGTDDPAAV
jgi:hypothetical protein